MRTYDVTLNISPDLVVWPGDPKVKLERVSKIEEGEVSNVTRIEMSAHTGTHVDAPFHFLAKGQTVEKLPLKVLMGRAYVLDVGDAELITADLLKDSPIPPRSKRVLFKTRNSKLWAKKDGTFAEDYVALDGGAADYLVKRGVKLVGVDYLSVAPFNDVKPAHEVLLKAGAVIVEGLDLSKVDQGRYTFYCLPLKLVGADGAPARAILVGV